MKTKRYYAVVCTQQNKVLYAIHEFDDVNVRDEFVMQYKVNPQTQPKCIVRMALGSERVKLPYANGVFAQHFVSVTDAIKQLTVTDKLLRWQRTDYVTYQKHATQQ